LEEQPSSDTKQKQKQKQNARRKSTRNLLRLLALPVEMVTGPVAGVLIGYYLDRYASTGPVFLAVFGLLGLAASVHTVIGVIKKL
jgi:ATP synthase protein I